MKKLSLLILFIIISKLSAQADTQSLIKQGLEFSYRFNLEKAEEIFEKIITKNPNDPRGYHYKSSVYLWTYLGNKEKSDYDKFMKYSDLAIEKASKVLEQHSNDENASYILGSNYGFRAMAFMKANSYLNAVWAVKKSDQYLKETLEKNPKNYDAYLGLGIFNYAVSLVPGVFNWALKMAGLSGDREAGISYLKNAYRNSSYSKTEAAYYLSQIYSESLIDYNTSLGYLKQLLKDYPGNVLFQYSYAVVLIKNKKPSEAEKVLRQIIKTGNPHFKQITSFSNFLIGDILFRKNDFRSAIGYYDKFISTTKEIDYTGIAYYRQALCLEILGKREEGKKLYIYAANGNLDIQDDAYAKRKSEVYLNRTVSANEIRILKASNMIESGLIKQAHDSLINIIPSLSAEKLKAEAYLYLSDVCYELGKYKEAVDNGMKAKSFNESDETWIKPYANYYLARAFYKLGNHKEAKNHLSYAEDISNYDYQTKLTALINALKLKLS